MADPKDSLSNEEAESPTFEDSFLRLSEMAEQLEAGDLTLAEATARFEEGMQLVQFCNDMLNNAELRITELKETYNTTLAQAFDEGNVEDFDE